MPARHRRIRGPLSRRALQSLAKSLRRPPREAGIAGDRWTAVRVNRLLRKRWGLKWSARYAVRRLRQAGVRVRLIRAREPRLTRRALETLRRTLRRAPSAVGIAGERWSRARLAELIERRFKKRFTPAHAGRLARRLRGRSLGVSRDRRLTAEQGRALRAALCAPAQAHPKTKPSWSCAQIATLIEERWGVRYHARSIPGVLKRWRIAVAIAPAVRGDACPTPEQLRELSAALSQPPTAAALCAPRWEQRYIAQFLRDRYGLHYPHRGLYGRLKRWGLTVPARASAGGACALSAQQRLTLVAALSKSPVEFGYSQAAWSRALIARFILERFQIHYARGSIPHVLRREGVRLRARREAPSTTNTLAEQSVGTSDPFPTLERPRPLASAPLTSRADFRS